MIDRNEITNMANKLAINTSHVQRDYVYGWILAGIYSKSDLGKSFVLKGGNCLRKAYLTTTRYSDDLDFALEGAMPQQDYLVNQLNLVCNFAHQNAGVEFDTNRTLVRKKSVIDNARQVFEARLYFRDFYGESNELVLRIRLDIAEFERISLPIQLCSLIHPYSDRTLIDTQIRCMKLEEMLAAKLKCLIQRRHSADLYDFVNATFLSSAIQIDREEVVSVFLNKTIFASGPGIVVDLLVGLPFDVLRTLWEQHLAIPQNALLDFEHAVSEFRSTITNWFQDLPRGQSEARFFPMPWRNVIMEAGHNQTVLRIVYDGKERHFEPYSLKYKRRKDGIAREYLYAYPSTGDRTSSKSIKSLLHRKITLIENTNESFEPRYEIELSKAGQLFGYRDFSVPRRRISRVTRRRKGRK